MGKLTFIGGGNMAEALIKGVLASADADAGTRTIRVADPQEARRRYLTDSYGISAFESNREAIKGADVVVFAVKPQVLDKVLVELRDDIAAGQVVVSIAAGVTIGRITSHLYADSKVVRVMPNTPALVGAGAAAIAPGPGLGADDIARVRDIFAAVGSVVMVGEEMMDAVTALSGSGPAYVFAMIEALSDGGVRAGLPRDVATTLAAQTVMGAARMVLTTGTHPATLKDMVTSPGGTTIAALSVLERNGFRGILMDAVEAAVRRAKELAG